jgi:Icc-related predicted phosphoesterase
MRRIARFARPPLLGLLVAIPAIVACGARSQYVAIRLPPGNEFAQPRDPVEDDAGQVLTRYDEFPASAREQVERFLPGGTVRAVNHWGPFRYTLTKEFPEGHQNEIYVHLNGYVHQIYFIDDEYMERPGLFYVSGTEREVRIADIPGPVRKRLEEFSTPQQWTAAWQAGSQLGPTFVVEMRGIQEGEITAFALSPDGTLKTMGTAERMHRGVPKLWTQAEIENLLASYRDSYGVRQVMARIRSVPFDRERGFRFVVFGDPQNHVDVLEAVCRSVSDEEPLFAVVTGDLVEDIQPDEYDEYFFDVVKEHAKFEIVPAIGNHDVGVHRMAFGHRAVFGDDSLNYHFDYGNARFVIMDNVSRVTPWEERIAAADRWLAETPAGYHKFVFAHVPPGEVERWSYHAMSGDQSREFTELMARHQVDHVFTGHIHAYSTAKLNGVGYTVTGGGGGRLHEQHGPKGSQHHYVIVDVLPKGVQQTVVQLHPRGRR